MRYDSGEAAPPAEARRSGFEGFDFSSRGPDYSATFGDLVAEVLIEHGARRPAAVRGTDLHHDVRISFADSFTGCEQALTVTRRETCRSCRGAGVARTAAGPCGLCQGQGVVRTVRGHMVFSRSCNAVRRHRAAARRGRARRAAGAGHEVRTERVTVRLPPGIADGERVRRARQGRRRAPGRSGRRPLRHGARGARPRTSGATEATCIVVLPVAVHEGGLGARIEVPVFDGTVKVRIPPGTQSGQQFRIRERGMASTRGGPRGDLVVEARLMLPAVLDERSRALLREFGEINDGAEIRRVPPAGSGAGSQD